jgi:TatD DNase family protein
MSPELRRFPFLQLDVFSSRPFEGNSLAVFPDGRGLSDLDMQALAREMNLPVIVHFRDVGCEGIETTGAERFRGARGVFHSFGGSPGLAERLVELGFYLGFTGPLTYRKSDRAEVARRVPLERILVETDSPFMAPRSHRGTRNEPAFVAEIADKLAEIRELDPAVVIAATGENARRLFGIGV